MPRKYVPIIPDFPYHISARCHNGEWFDLPMETVWSIMEDYLFLISALYGVQIHSFVLMSNHFHLILTASRGNLSAALLYFMRETSREITRLTGRINQTYGSRNHKTILGTYLYYMNTYKYIYRNPVRAGICDKVEEYPYSTLHGLCGLKPLIVPLVEDSILFSPDFDKSALQWLNSKPLVEQEEEIRQALRRPKFELKTSRKTGRPSLLENQLL